MSREDLYRVAGPPQYDPTRANCIKELSRFFKRRAGDKISVEESITFAAQILSSFDYKYRQKRQQINRERMPITL
jgi:hypothetical protein